MRTSTWHGMASSRPPPSAGSPQACLSSAAMGSTTRPAQRRGAANAILPPANAILPPAARSVRGVEKEVQGARGWAGQGQRAGRTGWGWGGGSRGTADGGEGEGEEQGAIPPPSGGWHREILPTRSSVCACVCRRPVGAAAAPTATARFRSHSPCTKHGLRTQPNGP